MDNNLVQLGFVIVLISCKWGFCNNINLVQMDINLMQMGFCNNINLMQMGIL